MDPRTHVALALARLHAGPPPLPEVGSLAYRSRLLDETGGDFKPLVVFLLQLAEAGVLAQIEAARRDGEPWDVTHRRIALGWSAEHYTQPDMARWAVAAWGAALGRCAVPEAPRAEPPPSVAAQSTARGAHPTPPPRRSSGRPAGPLTPSASSSHTPSFAASPPLTRPRAAGGARPYFNRAEKQAIAGILLTGFVAAGLIATMSPSDSTANAQRLPAPAAAMTPGAARGARAGHAPSPPPLSTLDAEAIGRLTPDQGAGYLAGAYRILARRQRVLGDDGCDALAATVPSNQWAVDTLVVDTATHTFHFATRPAIAGRIDGGGVFTSRPIVTQREETRSSYQLQGQLTPWGFEATGTTRTESTIRWRRIMRCEFVASLSGEMAR